MKIRSRKFSGRCGRHKSYNPAIDGPGLKPGSCARCDLLFRIWETSLKLNELIRKFDPSHDDLERPRGPEATEPDPRQMSLI